MISRNLFRFALATVVLLASGCTTWKSPSERLRELRDPRALDIDQRLAGPPPTIDHPFGR